MSKKLKDKLLKLLQKEGDKVPKTFAARSYDEGYWDGLKFAALLISDLKQ